MKRRYTYDVSKKQAAKRRRTIEPGRRPYSRRPKRVYRSKAGLPEEVKFFDTANAFNIDNTGEVPATGQLCLIPQGDTESTRDGRIAIIKSININGVLTFTPAAAATASGIIILYLILDTQANGAAAAVTDVFTSNQFVTHHINLNNSSRFKIIKRWRMGVNPPAGATTAYNNWNKPFNYFKKCNIKIDWDSTTGAITEIRSNNIFLMAGSSAGIDDLVSFAGTTRLRFIG